MQNEIVTPFAIAYQGKDTDRHIINAQDLGYSIVGASKLYNSVAHYTALGFVPRGNYKKEYSCYAQAQKEGSYEFWVFIAAITANANIHGVIYQESISYVFAKIVDTVKKIWTVPSKTDQTIAGLTDVLKEQAKMNSDLATVLANGIIQANDNLASLQGRLIDTLPALASATRYSGKELVVPIGHSCTSINQFKGTNNASKINQMEAEVIRGGEEMEIDEMTTFICNKISEINLVSGHCIVQLKGYENPIKGTINDPAIKIPNNIYTRALNEQTPFEISAKSVRKNGELYRLYISDAKKD